MASSNSDAHDIASSTFRDLLQGKPGRKTHAIFLFWWWKHMAVCQNLVPLVNIKIAGKWMFIPLKMVLIGIDPYPYGNPWFPWKKKTFREIHWHRFLVGPGPCRCGDQSRLGTAEVLGTQIWIRRVEEQNCLVVWNIFLFFHILGIMLPTDFHIFQRSWNHQPENVCGFGGSDPSRFHVIPGLESRTEIPWTRATGAGTWSFFFFFKWEKTLTM